LTLARCDLPFTGRQNVICDNDLWPPGIPRKVVESVHVYTILTRQMRRCRLGKTNPRRGSAFRQAGSAGASRSTHSARCTKGRCRGWEPSARRQRRPPRRWKVANSRPGQPKVPSGNTCCTGRLCQPFRASWQKSPPRAAAASFSAHFPPHAIEACSQTGSTQRGGATCARETAAARGGDFANLRGRVGKVAQCSKVFL